MKWQTALKFAREQSDVTYEEWCNLYVDMSDPTRDQVERALKTAHPILARNGIIEPSVVLYYSDVLRRNV
jgi:hypothetical protein